MKSVDSLLNYFRLHEKWFFLILTALFVVPVWLISDFPNIDGPSTLYSADIINALLSGRCQNYSEVFYITPYPPPNEISHWFLAIAMFLVSPGISEKLLLSLLFFSYCYGFRYWILYEKSDAKWPAYFAFLTVYNGFLYLGFYNFLISISLYFWLFGFWLRKKNALTARDSIAISLGLVAIYFAHLFGLMLTLLSMGVFQLLSLQNSKNIRQAGQEILRLSLIAAPSLFLVMGYLMSPKVGDLLTPSKFESIVQIFNQTHFEDLYPKDTAVSYLLSIMFFISLLIILSKAKHYLQSTITRPWWILLLILILITILAPTRIVGGSFVIDRLVHALLLTALMLISLSMKNIRNSFVALSFALTISFCFCWHTYSWFEKQPVLNKIRDTAMVIPERSTAFLQLAAIKASPEPSLLTSLVYKSAAMRYITRKCVVNTWLYQARNSGIFPVSIHTPWNGFFMDGLKEYPTISGVKKHPEMKPTYILTRNPVPPEDKSGFSSLLEQYDLIHSTTDPGIAVYKAR